MIGLKRIKDDLYGINMDLINKHLSEYLGYIDKHDVVYARCTHIEPYIYNLRHAIDYYECSSILDKSCYWTKRVYVIDARDAVYHHVHDYGWIIEKTYSPNDSLDEETGYCTIDIDLLKEVDLLLKRLYKIYLVDQLIRQNRDGLGSYYLDSIGFELKKYILAFIMYGFKKKIPDCSKYYGTFKDGCPFCRGKMYDGILIEKEDEDSYWGFD